MATKRTSLTDTIRKAVLHCGVSRYQIAKETGIAAPVLCRFVKGQRGMTLKNLDILAEYLGVRVVVDREPKGTKGKR